MNQKERLKHILLKTKTQNGITLISLIVTIVVMLILVGVTINIALQDGLFKATQKSVDQYAVAGETEEIGEIFLQWQFEEGEMSTFFEKKQGIENVQKNVDESITVKMPSGNRYKVTEDGEITLLDGAVEEPEPIVPEIVLDKTTITKEIVVGSTETETLTATLKNAEGELEWSSSDISVAEVSGTGTVGTITFKGAGTTAITVSYGEYKAECKITVTAKQAEVTLPAELRVGDIVEYSPASEYTSSSQYTVSLEGCSGSFYTDMTDVEWKVIGIEGNTIKIIPNAASTATLTISGANGWNNSIDALNSVCGAIYGNTTSIKYTATAKSLTVEDINGITGYTPTASTTSYNASDYGSKNKFPIEYLKEKGVTNPTETTAGCGYAENSEITVETTYYNYTAESQTGFNMKFASWVHLGKTYWLASRCVNPNSSRANFSVRLVFSGGAVNIGQVFASVPDDSYDYSGRVRPVVTLTPSVSPTLEKTVGEGVLAINYWKFE